MNKYFFVFTVLFFSLIENNLSAKPSVERGEYLVRGPGACGSCHTPVGPLTKNKNDRRVGPMEKVRQQAGRRNQFGIGDREVEDATFRGGR